jgi:iron complex transport system substrate-binding protein
MKHIIAILMLALSMAGCGRFGNKKDQTGDEERIVCIAKQYNEIIYALGAQKNLVAVDISSTYPPEIKKLPTVGYHRALTAEGLLAAQPTLIMHDNNIGPEHVLKQIEDLNIPMKVFKSKGDDLQSTYALMREMGAYFHKEKQADSLCRKLENDMNAAVEQGKKYASKPRVLIIHFGQASNIYLVMTQNSTAAKMIRWAGGEMAVTGEKGMKQLSAEVVAASNPDVILLTDFGYDRLGSKDKIGELPGIEGTNAFKNNRIYRVEEHDMVYIGPRTGVNVMRLQELIHKK